MLDLLRSHPRLWVPFRLRLRVAAIRRGLVRQRVVVRLVMVFVGVGVVVSVALFARRASEVQRQWGSVESVVVARLDHPAGAADAGVFVLGERPLVFVPEDALTELPSGSTQLGIALRAGDVITDRHLRDGPLATDSLPAGTRAVNLPRDLGVPPVAIGDSVELVVGVGRPAAALVVALNDEWVTVAVDAGRVPDVAAALEIGTVFVVLG